MASALLSLFLYVCVLVGSVLASPVNDGATRPTASLPPNPPDWLLQSVEDATAVAVNQLDSDTIELTNGLISRVFATSPFFATWDYANAHGSVLRSLSPAATVTLDDTTYNVGGAVAMKADGKTVCPLPVGIGPPDNCPTAYFNRSVEFATNASAFQYAGHWTSAPSAPFEWSPTRHAPAVPWPPLGLVLNVNFTAPATVVSPLHKDVVVTLHFEMYQGIPAMAKSITITLNDAALTQDYYYTANDFQGSSGRSSTGSGVGGGVPPDQQGPICLHKCDSVLPPSNWESRWILNATSTAAQRLQLNGEQDLCLTVVNGTAYHDYNDQLDALPCNESNRLQLWKFDPSSGILQSAADAGDLKHWCVDTTAPCEADVNNHQSDDGTTIQMSNSAAARWALVAAEYPAGDGDATTYRIKSTTFPTSGENCMWHTPLPAPPTPPTPLPKPVCDPTSNCTIVSGATVEILRTNCQYGPETLNGDGLLYAYVRDVHLAHTCPQHSADPH